MSRYTGSSTLVVKDDVRKTGSTVGYTTRYGKKYSPDEWYNIVRRFEYSDDFSFKAPSIEYFKLPSQEFVPSVVNNVLHTKFIEELKVLHDNPEYGYVDKNGDVVEYKVDYNVCRTGFQLIYKYVHQNMVHDFQNDYKLRRLKDDYFEFLRKISTSFTKDEKKVFNKHLVRLKGDEEYFQEVVAKEVHDFASVLYGIYVELDNDIEVGNVDENDFNYKGFNELYRYSRKSTLRSNYLPKYNENMRWLHVFESLSKGELKQSHNPFIKKLLLQPLFKAPFYDMEVPLHISDSVISTMRSRIITHVNKVFKFALENQKVGREFYLLKQVDKALYKQYFVLDGEEIQNFLRMYNISRNMTYAFDKYPVKTTHAQTCQYCGLRSGLTTSNNTKRYRDEMDIINNTLQDELLLLSNLENMSEQARKEYKNYNMDLRLTRENIPYLERAYDQRIRMLESYEAISGLQNIVYEQILSNENARNVTGAIFGLTSIERGSYQDLREEQATQEVKVTIDVKDIQLES